MINTADMRETYHPQFNAGKPHARDIYGLTDEVDRLRAVLRGIWPFLEEDISADEGNKCITAEYAAAIEAVRKEVKP